MINLMMPLNFFNSIYVFIIFIILFFAVLDLHCGLFSNWLSGGYSRGLRCKGFYVAMASPMLPGSSHTGSVGCELRLGCPLHHGILPDLGSGDILCVPGGFLTSGPPGIPNDAILVKFSIPVLLEFIFWLSGLLFWSLGLSPTLKYLWP